MEYEIHTQCTIVMRVGPRKQDRSFDRGFPSPAIKRSQPTILFRNCDLALHPKVLTKKPPITVGNLSRSKYLLTPKDIHEKFQRSTTRMSGEAPGNHDEIEVGLPKLSPRAIRSR